MPIIKRLLLTALLLLITAAPTAAQYGPDERSNQPGDGDNPTPGGPPMAVPDYIKPGFQFFYLSASFAQSTEYKKPHKSAMGYIEFTVVKVLGD
ncbi:MAG: hypothetical protein AAF085_10780, partial [Planctomycetota bacterium]